MSKPVPDDFPHPRPNIDDVAPYTPGRAQSTGTNEVHKLSSNESPFGPSPLALAAYEAAAKKIGVYPDGGSNDLRAAIGATYNLDPSRIICGAGIDDLLVLISRVYLTVGDEAIYTQYGFNMYAIDIAASGAKAVVVPEQEFTADVDAILSHVTARTKVVFLANPNNPTGTYLPAREIKRLYDGLPKSCLFVLDEAYNEFVDDEPPCGFELAKDAANILVTRTFSKAYALAGLRLGFAYGPQHVIDSMNKVRLIFGVSTAASAAGIAALQDQNHVSALTAHVNTWRPWLFDALTALGLKVTPSKTNFLLVHFDETGAATAKAADAFLMDKGYILRRLEPYGLTNALRLTIGTAQENQKIVELLRAFLEQNA